MKSKSTCRQCGKPKRRHDVLCQTCWAALPQDLRTAFRHAANPADRTAAIRRIFDHVIGTPSLF